MEFDNDTDRLPARSRRWANIGGAWLEASIECSTTKSDLFDLALSLRAADGPLTAPALQERFAAISLDPTHPRYAPRILAGSEIAGLVGALAAPEAPPQPAAEPPRRRETRRFRRPAFSRRTQRVAGALALLSLLFPGIAFVPAGARADGGITGSTVVTAPTTPTRDPTVPTDTTPTTTTPTVTTPTPPAPPPVTVPTDTTPTTTTPTTTTPTDTTSTTTTPTETTPTDTTPEGRPTGPSKPSAPKPAKSAKPVTTSTAKKTKKAAKPKKKEKAKADEASNDQILTLPGVALDPTPANLRLRPAFAENLTAEAARAHVDWALMLGVIRAKGATGVAPASGATLQQLAARLVQLDATSDPRDAAYELLGTDRLANRAVALSHYYEAVGLPTLVHGLRWAKPLLQDRVLADSRVQIYPGGRDDIANGRIDVRVLAAIEYLAQTYDEVTVSCLITGHGLYARPGVISAHMYGLAVDISAVKNIPIAGHQNDNGITESAIRSILMLPPEMQPNQVISLLDMGGPSFALANHWDHIHIGFAPVPYAIQENEHLAPSGNPSLVELWQSAGATYGVPWQVLAAINKIESNYGQNMGPSSAGAVGWMQFMPSTWARWGTDANGDGRANPWEPADAIYSAARYLSAAGASTNLPRAIYAYNHAQWYVDEVLQLAGLFGDNTGGAYAGLYGTFTLADDEIAPLQRNLALAPEPPLSAYSQRAHGMDGGVRGLPIVKTDTFSNGVAVITELLASAQRSLPEAGSTVDLNARSLAFHTLATEPAAAYELGVQRSLADQSVLADLPHVLVPLGLMGIADEQTTVSATPAPADDTSVDATDTP